MPDTGWLQYSVPAAIGAGAVLLSNWLEGRREHARTDASNKQRDQELKAERQQALDDYWREARHRAHVDAITWLDVHLKDLNDMLLDTDAHDLDAMKHKSWAATVDFNRLRSMVDIVASDDTSSALGVDAKGYLHARLITFHYLDRVQSEDSTWDEDGQRMGRVLSTHTSAADSLQEYREAVRRELGTGSTGTS